MSYDTQIISMGESEYIEKKSRFLGVVIPVGSEEEAQEFIRSKKKEHYNARHNCYAYIVSDLESETPSPLKRYSDDGEPSGTAGRPILDALEYKGIINAVLVVTRYFGGVLLGTGGLTRAYTQAAKEALENAETVKRVEGRRVTIETDYNGYGKVEYILRESDLAAENTDYTDKVTITLLCPEEKTKPLCARITEETAASAKISISDPLIYTCKTAP